MEERCLIYEGSESYGTRRNVRVRAIWNAMECSGIWGESYRVMENVLGESDGV